MYSPLTGAAESFTHNKEIPRLEPMGRHTKSPKSKIYNYINKQNIRLAFEIEPPSCQAPNKEFSLALVSEIEGFNPQ